MKALTNNFTELLMKEKNPNQSSLYKTDLFSMQISSSDNDAKAMSDTDAIFYKLSL